MRFGLDRSDEPRTLADIGDGYKLTRERIRQIEAKALDEAAPSVHGSHHRVDDRVGRAGQRSGSPFWADRPARPGQRDQRACRLVLQLGQLVAGEPARLDDLDRGRPDRVGADRRSRAGRGR